MVDAACVRLGRELALVGRTVGDFALCTALRYPSGAGIGWHADSPAYGPTVLSLSLGAAACLQLRRSDSEDTTTRFELVLAPRSLFVLAGEARTSWVHRVRPVRAERYSLTVRCGARAGQAA
jgi:alkylated DNA repair dioxygenase AlkB